jgi:hypothetical protein
MGARGVKPKQPERDTTAERLRAELATRSRPWKDALVKLDEHLGAQLPLPGDKQRFQKGVLASALATALRTPQPENQLAADLDAYELLTASLWADRLGI